MPSFCMLILAQIPTPHSSINKSQKEIQKCGPMYQIRLLISSQFIVGVPRKHQKTGVICGEDTLYTCDTVKLTTKQEHDKQDKTKTTILCAQYQRGV